MVDNEGWVDILIFDIFINEFVKEMSVGFGFGVINVMLDNISFCKIL